MKLLPEGEFLVTKFGIRREFGLRLTTKLLLYELGESFEGDFFLPSSGISSCGRTADMVMCLHTWPSPAM